MKKRTRMYEPWGYQDQNDYQGTETILENDLESFFAEVSYNKDDNMIHFANKDGEEKATLDVNEFVKSQVIVERAWYEDGKIHIKFTNGDEIIIDVEELLDENEFKDGLQVNEGQVSVLINSAESDEYISVDANGIKLTGVKRDIDAETARATAEEERLDAKIDAETERATEAEQTLDTKVNDEIQRAQESETILDSKISDEIQRAQDAETTISNNVSSLNSELDAEELIRESKDTELKNMITSETTRATNAETTLQAAIESEGQRAQDAETALSDEISNLQVSKFDDVVYDSSAKTITFYADNQSKATIDTTDFVVDGMIDDVKIENGNLVITFNTDSGKEAISIPLIDIFDPNNYYDKAAIDGIASGINESIANEAATRLENDNALSQSIEDETTRAEGVESALLTSIEAESSRATSAETDLQAAIDLKADKETTYTQAEVDALIKAKETEIYNLTKLVGEIGGNVTYTYPNDLGTSLTSLLGNYGTVKLSEDATISRYGPGVTAKNKVTLNLNNHNLTSTSAGSYGAIMARGTQEITIGGKGTIEAGDGICIEANGASAIINLTGSTTVYHTNRPGGELIYCYVGTINITNGTFRNDGESNYTLNCYDANYQNGTAKIIVTGGKFYDFNPADNRAEGEHTNFVAEGYHVEISTDGDSTVYTVKKDA